jgi:hypothetical protein
MRSERKRANQQADKTEIGKFREWARKQPPCEHGHPGGDLTDPAGTILCPFCRRERSPKPPQTTTTRR